jgi:hypothetical protein
VSVVGVLRPSLRWILAVAATIVAIGIFLLVRFFPFSERVVTDSLRETFPSDLRIDRFKTTYFPHPGCSAEGVTFRAASGAQGSAPIATIRKLTIVGHYSDFIWRPHHIASVTLDGLLIHVPPLGDAGQFQGGYTQSPMTIGAITADGTLLEFAHADNSPVTRFDVHRLLLESVSSNGGMAYRVALHNPTPPGEVQANGHFGPFHADDPGQTPASGSYSIDGADLGVFDGIAGTVVSQGSFSGALNRIEIRGTSDAANFEVVRSGHAAPLKTRFDILVNALNGDVGLTSVNANYFNTAIHANGSVASRKGFDRKFTALDFEVRDGRIQDLLRLFVHSERPPMTGAANLTAHVTVPPDGKPFLQEVTLQGEFDIADGHFPRESRQDSVNSLSLTARGMKKSKENGEEAPPATVAAHAHGHSSVHDGMATFPDLMFVVPGADARMHGTYNLLNEKIDLHGTVKMDAKFSQSTSGIKAVFAKVLDPFLNKKQGSVVPVLVDGTYGDPHFGLDLNPMK